MRLEYGFSDQEMSIRVIFRDIEIIILIANCNYSGYMIIIIREQSYQFYRSKARLNIFTMKLSELISFGQFLP